MAKVPLIVQLAEKLQEGTALIEKCHGLEEQNIKGAGKLQKKITTEINFFEQLREKPSCLKFSHLVCSNLPHLGGIVNAANSSVGVISVLTPFRESEDCDRLIVDVVAESGSKWMKIVARNPVGLLRGMVAGDSRNERNLLVQARDFARVAQANPHMFQAPTVVFQFLNGVPDRLAGELTKLGIQIEGNVVDSSELPNWVVEEDSDVEEESDSEEEVDVSDLETSESLGADVPVNLDISALFALVSSLTNGGAGFRFREQLLDEQASWERANPVLTKINRFLEGKRLICCETARRCFGDILETVGGEGERARALKILKRVEVVPDRVSDRAFKLSLRSSRKRETMERSRRIFGSGDFYKAVTLTANRHFVQAAAHQGVNFAVFLHESRALSEQKQAHAVPLS